MYEKCLEAMEKTYMWMSYFQNWNDFVDDIKLYIPVEEFTEYLDKINDGEVEMPNDVWRKKNVSRALSMYREHLINDKGIVLIPKTVSVITNDEQASHHRTPGFFVYMISYPQADVVKIGKHTGGLNQLRTRYNTHVPGEYTIHAFPVVDNTLVEKGIHALLDSFGLREKKNREMFRDTPKTREVFFGLVSLVQKPL